MAGSSPRAAEPSFLFSPAGRRDRERRREEGANGEEQADGNSGRGANMRANAGGYLPRKKWSASSLVSLPPDPHAVATPVCACAIWISGVLQGCVWKWCDPPRALALSNSCAAMGLYRGGARPPAWHWAVHCCAWTRDGDTACWATRLGVTKFVFLFFLCKAGDLEGVWMHW